MRRLSLEVLPESLSICRLPPDSTLPEVATRGSFWSVTKTDQELSIVTTSNQAPANCEQESGWRCMRVGGILDFSLTGVITAIATPLAQAGISILPISTYETDYLLVRDSDLENAISALKEAGHFVQDARVSKTS